MPKFSKRSQSKLEQCDKRLNTLFNEVVRTFDCSILEGHRNQETQDRYYQSGKSKLTWPRGKHNKTPSLAVDATPYPINWKDISRFYYFGGYVKGIARMLSIPIRWGGDWDDDTKVNDQRFKDLVHFELKS